MFNSDNALKKWAPVLEHADAPKIKDSYRKAVTAVLLENQEKAMKEERAQSSFLNESTTTGSIQNFDPILISLVRRAMPNLIAYDVAGVQPMSAPTGLIFALKPKYQTSVTNSQGNQVVNGDDALYGGQNVFVGTYEGNSNTVLLNVTPVTDSGLPLNNIAVGGKVVGQGIPAGAYIVSIDTTNDGANDGKYALTLNANTTITGAGLSITYIQSRAPINSAFSGDTINDRQTYTTAIGEGLTGDYPDQNYGFKNMGFSIEKSTVTANTRALKADYTMELAQDLKAVHGLDAESELANILSSEILFEINREVIETINRNAFAGANYTTTPGTYDVAADADGRWAVERYKAMLVQIELEANQIAKDTRRGKGNFIICSSNVASTLASTGVLNYAPALSTDLQVDDTGNTFAGVLNGRVKVYVDPYSTSDYVTVGYRGTNPYDAGLFYAPYVPLTMVRAVDPATFQPKIAFKTRYGLVANPFVQQTLPANAMNQAGIARSNFYYRNFAVTNLSLKGTQLFTNA